MRPRCCTALLITVHKSRKVNIPLEVLPGKFQVTNCNGNPGSRGYSRKLGNRLVAVALLERVSNKGRSSMAVLLTILLPIYAAPLPSQQ
ncbi:hypothetical protein WN51_04101 [Melipona quadrifasciata]|uniref:Uncharacterized protein n=1 Tax=Melipona quadrifasciata TaxID=166423 RepID=A0A0M8ZPT3_9HYME|nr:hypothetical protein WN51_04101 [Melipona quadrifasciata]